MKPEYIKFPRCEYEEKIMSVIEFMQEYGSQNIPFAVYEFHTLKPVSVTLVAEKHWENEEGSRKYAITVTDNREAIYSLFGCSTEYELIDVLTGRNEFYFGNNF